MKKLLKVKDYRLIACLDEKSGIGRNGTLFGNFPDDLFCVLISSGNNL